MNNWPSNQTQWDAYAVRCTTFYPDMATDWNAHHQAIQRRLVLEPVPEPEPPLSPEDEETLF